MQIKMVLQCDCSGAKTKTIAADALLTGSEPRWGMLTNLMGGEVRGQLRVQTKSESTETDTVFILVFRHHQRSPRRDG